MKVIEVINGESTVSTLTAIPFSKDEGDIS